MSIRETRVNKGWQFVGVTALLSIVPYFFMISEGSTASTWALALMWVPAIAAILMRLIHKEGLFSEVRWNPLPHLPWLLLAALVPLAIEILTIALSIASGAAELKPEFLAVNGGFVRIQGIAMLFGAGAQPWYGFILNFVISYLVGTLFYSVFMAFGEEFGWRGYLQKEWGSRDSLTGYILIGAVWGLWHAPGVLLGHNFPDYPVLGAFLLMPIVTIIFSVAFGSVYERNRLIWVPALFHGGVNMSAEMSNVALIDASINRPLNDFIWIALWAVAAFVFWRAQSSVIYAGRAAQTPRGSCS